MFRVIVKRPSVPVGQKGYKKQVIGIFLIDRDGIEDDFPTPVSLLLGPDEADHKPGTYTIHPSSFGITADKYGQTSLTVKRISLQPVIEKADRKAA